MDLAIKLLLHEGILENSKFFIFRIGLKIVVYF